MIIIHFYFKVVYTINNYNGFQQAIHLSDDDESIGSSVYDLYEYGQISSCDNYSDQYDSSDKDPEYTPNNIESVDNNSDNVDDVELLSNLVSLRISVKCKHI